MSESGSLTSIGELTKPATVLIEKISDAIGGFCKPWQTRRVAEAEAAAAIIRAESEIKIGEIERRALERLIREEARKQSNIENITLKALPELEEDTKSSEVEEDWIADLFDKCRSVSDEQMQTLWARVLAGEANNPGSYSKRTISLLATLEKTDLEAFDRLCQFRCNASGPTPLILDLDAAPYKDAKLSQSTLRHLDELGLIQFNSIGAFEAVLDGPCAFSTSYHEHYMMFELPDERYFKLPLGRALFTQCGLQLQRLTKPTFNEQFLNYLVAEYRKLNVTIEVTKLFKVPKQKPAAG